MDTDFIDIERGQRLRQERRQLELTQVEAAARAGIQPNSWVRFEKRGEPFDLKVVQLLQAAGFDMMWVVFGIRRGMVNPRGEQLELLRLYEQVKPDMRASLLLLVQTFATTHSI